MGDSAWHLPGEISYVHPDGKRGWHRQGLKKIHDGSGDWHDAFGVRFEVMVPVGRAAEIEATLKTPAPDFARQEFIPSTRASVRVSGDGWRTVTLPWSAFDFNKSQSALLRFVKELRLAGKFADGKPGDLQVKNFRLTRADTLLMESPVRGKAVQAGETARYEVTLGNCTDAPQNLKLSMEKIGWESMPASVEPSLLTLAPGEIKRVSVSVTVPTRMPAGGHERQKLIATSVSGETSIGFITARDVPRPFILHTVDGWNEVRDKVKRYPWAAESQQNDYVETAGKWRVPVGATPEQWAHGPENHAYVFTNEHFGLLEKTAIAWQLTRNKEFAEKAALFLRRLADEKTGYPATMSATSMDQPQEGGNFQSIAMAYDMILDADVLTDGDRRSIERVFRLYMENMVEMELVTGNVGNWNTAMATGALFCSVAMGDLAATERYIHGPCGFTDYLSKSIMDDGWWWECSTGYNLWCAAELTQSALACRPWGIDLLNFKVPANCSTNTIITPFATGTPVFGINFEKWGPSHRNTRDIKMLWDASPQAADYRGILFGMNDGHEELLGGSRMELAYYAFRDPAYVSIIRMLPKRDLIYGVPELPANPPKLGEKSASAENIGFALLRSQTDGRPQREQIQAVLKHGSHGGYHGHFDRCSLNTLMRYGRSFYNPESIWHGYPSSLYKFYVQTSVNHNMVVVDGRMQEAVEPVQRLFHSGKMMQAAMVETNARWSDPPYGGMVYKGGETLADRQWMNGQSYPIVPGAEWGKLGPYSERVLQRRLMVVTDDYVVLADWLKGGKPHTFDNLLQMKSFRGMKAADLKPLRHDPQYDADPRSSGQFITDANWFTATAPAVARYEYRFGPEVEHPGTLYNEPGTLNVDVHTLWPREQEIMRATPPENLGERQRVTYTLKGDGKVLAEGRSGVWVLGGIDIDVPVEGVKELTLEVTSGEAKRKSLFLAGALVTTADGKESSNIRVSTMNASAPDQSGRDYYGGPIRIAGRPIEMAIPAQPEKADVPAEIRIKLEGLNASRFKATLGGDYPFGDESDRREVLAVRSKGTEARFLTVLEPYENKALVKTSTATGPDSLRVELTDGRVQEITLHNLSGNGDDVSVQISETKDGKVLRRESTSNP